MAKFLIQTVDGHVKHDFSFALVEAIEYQNWRNAGLHSYEFVDSSPTPDCVFDIRSYVPVGTIQFVSEFLVRYHDIKGVRPINIPKQLRTLDFLKRNVEFTHKKDLVLVEKKFIKSNQNLKGYVEITNSTDFIPDVELLVSDLIDIDAEWRCFVYNRKLVGLQYYSGDFCIFPDVEFVKECIEVYSDCPPAYTLDVGVNKQDGTFVIEVHNFYSCGLYGFNDSRILPQMFIRAFNHLLKYGS